MPTLETDYRSFLVVSCSFSCIAGAENCLPGRKTALLAKHQLEASGWHQGSAGAHLGGEQVITGAVPPSPENKS